MTRVAGLLATSTSSESGAMLAARVAHLAAAGWDARLVCKGDHWAADPALHDAGLEGRVAFTDGSRQWRRVLRRQRPDLIHCHSGPAAWKAIGLRRSLGSRIVVSFRDDGGDLNAVPELEPVWREADLFVFSSRAMLDRAAAIGCPPERAEVLLRPLKPAGAVTPTRGDARRLRLVSAGQLIWEHGFEHSVHAVRLLLDSGLDCEYRIVAEFLDHPAVFFARHQLGLSAHVEVVNPRDDEHLVEEILAADVFVDPAVTDTVSPVPLQAARAAGVPCVATARDSLPEGLAITVRRRSPAAIAEAVTRLAGERRFDLGPPDPAAGGVPTLEEHVQGLEALYRRTLEVSR